MLRAPRVAVCLMAPGARRAGTYRGENVENVDHYATATYTAGKSNTRVVCRQKPLLKSRAERFWEYMKPTLNPGHEVLDTVQLCKILGYLATPVFLLMWWKGAYAAYPDEWESRFAGFQNRPSKEVENGATGESYFDVIDRLESRRDQAMRNKGYDSTTAVPAPKA